MTKNFYNESYSYDEQEFKVLKLGYDFGRSLKTRGISRVNFEEFLDWELQDIREHFGIKERDLLELFDLEKREMPRGKYTERLPSEFF
mmetsp:Transcript_38596/g.36946  ORF Transcript_38596/g.36946 Transcript_38596/m.36946 type:complete len:88 (-) Transcript_38596:34-297(-)